MPGADERRDEGSAADADLRSLARQGSAAAVEALYERYLPPIWRYVRSQLRGYDCDAEDIVSETFLAAIRGLKGIHLRGGPLYPWLAAIARRKIADHWRRRRRSRTDPAGLPSDESSPAGSSDPAGRLEAVELRDLVAEAMGKLRDEERLVLEWKYVDRLSLREIADRMSRTERAVQGILYRARNSFRAVFPGLDCARPHARSLGEEIDSDARE